MVEDSHQHFWKYTAVEYGWIPPDWDGLRRDFLPAELKQEMAAAKVGGTISVQARQSLEETRWLLDLADSHDFIRGLVGWLPLASPGIESILAEFSERPKLRAARHVVQGEADPLFMLRPEFEAGVRALAAHGLAYDSLILEHQLPQAIEFVDRHPHQTFILDHIAKPGIRAKRLEPWKTNLPSFAAAQKAMTGLKSRVYRPRVPARRTYERLFGLYRQMRDAFGGLDRAADVGRAMKELLQIKSVAAP